MKTIQPSRSSGPRNQWTISYTQSDVDTIREQIEQNESAKRHWLVLGLMIALVALAGTITLLSTSYALYSSSQSDKKTLADQNASLNARAEKVQQELDAKLAQETGEAKSRAEAQARIDDLMPLVMSGKASGNQVAEFARRVYLLPGSRVEMAGKPPDRVFRNWRTSDGSNSEVFTLVGGFVDGKWVVYSNLIARRSESDS